MKKSYGSGIIKLFECLCQKFRNNIYQYRRRSNVKKSKIKFSQASYKKIHINSIFPNQALNN